MKNLNKIIKDKLENYQETPPQSILDNIRHKYPKRTFVENLNYNKYYIVAGIGAIIIAGLCIFNNPSTKNNNINISNDEINIVTNNKKSANEISTPKTDNDNEINSNNNTKTNIINNDSSQKPINKTLQIEYINYFPFHDTVICGTSFELNNISEFENLIIPEALETSKKDTKIIINSNKTGNHTIYYCKEHNNKLIKDSLIIKFNEINIPKVKFQNNKLCYGEELLVNIYQNNIQTSFINNKAVKLSENIYQIDELKSGDNKIQILFTDANNCVYTYTEQVYVNSKPDYDINITPSFCSNKNGSISIIPNNFDLYSTELKNTFNSKSNSKSGSFVNLSAGIYFLKTEYSKSCYMHDTLLVRDSLNISPYFKIEKDLIDKNKYSVRNHTKIDNRGYEQNHDIEFIWQVNGENLVSNDNPEFTFDKQGEYKIELIASINNNCVSKYSETIHVSGTIFRIPNIFTPNGDGIGDYFKIISENELKNFHIQIISKTGEIVFESLDINNCWDGKINGNNDASEGAYYYIIRGEDLFGSKIEQKGSLQLVRN